MDFEKYELISDTESVEDDQQQISSTSYDLAAKGEKTSRILFKSKMCKFSSNDETKLINCNRHIRRNHKVSTEQEKSHYTEHSNLTEETDERRIKNGKLSSTEVRSTLNCDTKYKQDHVRQENTYQSFNSKSKRKLDGSNSDDKVQVKMQRLSLDKDKKILTLSDNLYSENCSREDFLANTSSIKTDSDKNNVNEMSFKEVESNDNETDVDLPTLKRPRRRFLNSPEIRLTHTYYSIIPDSGENTEFEDKEFGNNYSTCFSTIHSKIRIKLESEKGVDIPRLGDFQNNLKIRETNKNVSVAKSSASNIVGNVKHKSKNTNQSVYKHYGTTSGVEQSINGLDKNSGIPRHFNLLDTEADIGRIDENDFSDGNDSISTSCNENHYETNASNKNKAEQKISEESKCESISVENTNIKDLSVSFPVPSKEPAKTYPITLPSTQQIIIDRMSETKFKADTKKEQLQASGIKKKKCNASNNDNVNHHSSSHTLQNKIVQSVTVKFWDRNNLIRKVLDWNPAWFNEFECKTTPDDILKNVGHHLSAYENKKDYFKTVLPHLLLETWESCLRSWQILTGKRTVTKCIFWKRNDANSSTFSHAFFTVKDHSFNKNDVLILRSSTNDDRNRASLCYIEDITHKLSHSLKSKSTYCDADIQVSSAETGDTVLKLQLKSSHFEMGPGSKICESTLEFVHSLRDVLSIYDGLATSFETQLIRHLLKPGNIDIFKSISMERNERASDVLVNKNDFNALQRRAILNASDTILDRNMKNCVCLIRGPFGTGKTDILIGIIKTVFQKSGGKCCIALCAPSEVAVEHLMKMLIRERQKIQLSKTGLVLIGDDSSYHPDVQAYSHKTHVRKEKEYHKRKTATPSVLNELQQLKEKIAIIKATDHGTDAKKKIEINQLSKKRNELIHQMSEERLERDVLLQGKVICGTFKSFGEQLYLNVLSSVKNNCRKSIFTCMIMDEAQQASELETLLPLQYGPSKLIMAGDLEQLAPKIKSKPSRDHSFGQSLFERLCDHFRFHGDKNTVLVLKTQYRSHPEIAKFPSEMFYGQHIDTHRHLKERSKMFNLKPYIVFNIERAQTVTAVDITVSLCEFLYSVIQNTRLTKKDFGIITSSDEISKIKEGLANIKLENMEVDTVTGFQGRSKEIIILSCSGSNTDKNGFLTCHKELNVALTRARSALYVVGNLDALSEENEAFQKLLADAKERDILREVKEDYVSNDIFRACLSAKSRLGR
ncbi:senataxin [Mytilus galloprovincialis]|uniref:Senataxin n=1 Tax=Mytilus galloprovincialis TaxID=29158 RepID=A0A8B6GT36_MYTGA|nr:senataxin [Mytilus galloprovincialis]